MSHKDPPRSHNGIRCQTKPNIIWFVAVRFDLNGMRDPFTSRDSVEISATSIADGQHDVPPVARQLPSDVINAGIANELLVVAHLVIGTEGHLIPS